MVDTFEKAGIFLETDPTKDRVEFQVWPDVITDAKSVNWADVNVIGRSEPIKTYQSGAPRTFNFTLTFVASVDEGDEGTAAEVKKKIRYTSTTANTQKW